MSIKQVQDAYIVAATRTPIGKSGRGYFRNTRPDDLLVAAVRSALAQVPTLDPKAIEDAIIGCAMPASSRRDTGTPRVERPVGRIGGAGKLHRSFIGRVCPAEHAH